MGLLGCSEGPWPGALAEYADGYCRERRELCYPYIGRLCGLACLVDDGRLAGFDCGGDSRGWAVARELCEGCGDGVGAGPFRPRLGDF